MRFDLSMAAITGALACASTVTAAEPWRYDARDLGVGGDEVRTQAEGMNDAARVVGEVTYPPNGPTDGLAIGVDGHREHIFSLGDGRATFVKAINGQGHLAGWVEVGDGYQSFIADVNGLNARMLETLGRPATMSAGINLAGQVAGQAQDRDEVWHAFVTGPRGRGLRVLDPPGATQAIANAINDAGQVTGSYSPAAGGTEVFLAPPGGRAKDTGIPGEAYAINDKGQLAGLSLTSNYPAFITGPGGRHVRLLPNFAGAEATVLRAINTHGQAVGEAQLAGNGGDVAAVTDPEGQALYRLDQLTELPPGVILVTGRCIDDSGRIASTGSDGHIYLLTPRKNTGGAR